MKVILVGYSKTGTKTMAAAFRNFGYRTYDTTENFYFLYKGWDRIFTGKATSEEIRQMYEGVDAVVDTPTFLHWRALADAFPEAKLILTTRIEDSWYKSLVRQIRFHNRSRLGRFTTVFSPLYWLRNNYQRNMNKAYGDYCFDGTIQLYPEESLKSLYREHNASVLQNARKDRLLVFKVTDGWKPLCEFLGEEIPDIDFPHENKGSTYTKETSQTTTSSQLISSAVFTFSALLIVVSVVAKVFFAYLFF